MGLHLGDDEAIGDSNATWFLDRLGRRGYSASAMARHAVKPSPVFDRAFRPGNDATHDGIYVCLNSGLEFVAKGGVPLPNVKQREHRILFSGIQWQLSVSISANSRSLLLGVFALFRCRSLKTGESASPAR
ncbi:hypothetical protein RCH10_004837 [Variovorax sp. GrIS 2.14]|uniref:hypothetical protein n=1 Tax=Variovorax sp. GrIS 2.14 TaxID=3071709 RepID=UPI0038F6040B